MTVAGALAMELHRRGVTQNQKQAEFMGEPPPNWTDYRTGKRNPTMAKVEGWARRAGVGLIYSGGRWTVG